MTDAGIPMGEGLASALARLGSKIEAGEIAGGLTQPFNGKRYFVVSQEQYEHDTRRSPADTPPPAAAGDRSLARFERDDECNVEFGTVPDCDCPHEHWHVNGVCLDVHIEEDRTGHIILTLEDDPIELQISGVADIGEARAIAFAWAAKRLRLSLRTPEPDSGGEGSK